MTEQKKAVAARFPRQMSISEYFDAQKENLRSSSLWEPFVTIFPLVDKLYVDAIRLTPSGPSPLFGQLLLICHKSFLSAASLIGQAQPEDAGPITRRAIEAARFAAATKTNPEKAKEWMASRERLQRWIDRQQGKKPKWLDNKFAEIHPGIKLMIDKLMEMHGVLSDTEVHFTPEFVSRLAWDRRNESMYLNYFTKDPRELERTIVLTSATHLNILEVIDWCFDGALKSNADWLTSLNRVRQSGAALAKKFEMNPDTK